MNKQLSQDLKNIKKSIRTDLSSMNRNQRRAYKQNIHKKYDAIYEKYGKKAYLMHVPYSIQNANINSLIREGKFIEMINKFGDKYFHKYADTIKATDIYMEAGSFKYSLYKTKLAISTHLKSIAAIFCSVLIGGQSLLLITAESNKETSFSENRQEITEYLDYVEDYGLEVKQENLTDLEVIMKVMNDMWNTIDGYGTPQKDLDGYLGLDMYQEDAVGVCRNMADDCARKYNAINPKYNARVIVVQASFDASNVELADIDRTFVESSEPEENVENVESGIDLQPLFGNHAVVLLDIPSDNVTLIVDPTNPAIGVYIDGEIKMFNSLNESGIHIDRRFLGDQLLLGYDSLNYPEELLDSFKHSKLSFEELNTKYGIGAQNAALDSLRKKEMSFTDYLKEYYENDPNYINYYNSRNIEPIEIQKENDGSMR